MKRSAWPSPITFSLWPLAELFNYKYTKIKSGYMGQLVEWPEVVTEGKTPKIAGPRLRTLSER